MSCFNYIANIIKLMRLLSREGMRDVDIGICWDAGYIGICGIGGEDGGICGDMWDGPPPRNRPGRAAVFGPAPPNPRRTGNRNGKLPAGRKKNAYFVFKLLIVNNINQYFNICLHLIRFITYNRRIFIAKYLFENKTCSIFVYVKITLTNRRTRSPYKSRGYGQI